MSKLKAKYGGAGMEAAAAEAKARARAAELASTLAEPVYDERPVHARVAASRHEVDVHEAAHAAMAIHGVRTRIENSLEDVGGDAGGDLRQAWLEWISKGAVLPDTEQVRALHRVIIGRSRSRADRAMAAAGMEDVFAEYAAGNVEHTPEAVRWVLVATRFVAERLPGDRAAEMAEVLDRIVLGVDVSVTTAAMRAAKLMGGEIGEATTGRGPGPGAGTEAAAGPGVSTEAREYVSPLGGGRRGTRTLQASEEAAIREAGRAQEERTFQRALELVRQQLGVSEADAARLLRHQRALRRRFIRAAAAAEPASPVVRELGRQYTEAAIGEGPLPVLPWIAGHDWRQRTAAVASAEGVPVPVTHTLTDAPVGYVIPLRRALTHVVPQVAERLEAAWHLVTNLPDVAARIGEEVARMPRRVAEARAAVIADAAEVPNVGQLVAATAVRAEAIERGMRITPDDPVTLLRGAQEHVAGSWWLAKQYRRMAKEWAPRKGEDIDTEAVRQRASGLLERAIKAWRDEPYREVDTVISQVLAQTADAADAVTVAARRVLAMEQRRAFLRKRYGPVGLELEHALQPVTGQRAHPSWVLSGRMATHFAMAEKLLGPERVSEVSEVASMLSGGRRSMAALIKHPVSALDELFRREPFGEALVSVIEPSELEHYVVGDPAFKRALHDYMVRWAGGKDEGILLVRTPVRPMAQVPPSRAHAVSAWLLRQLTLLVDKYRNVPSVAKPKGTAREMWAQATLADNVATPETRGRGIRLVRDGRRAKLSVEPDAPATIAPDIPLDDMVLTRPDGSREYMPIVDVVVVRRPEPAKAAQFGSMRQKWFSAAAARIRTLRAHNEQIIIDTPVGRKLAAVLVRTNEGWKLVNGVTGTEIGLLVGRGHGTFPTIEHAVAFLEGEVRTNFDAYYNEFAMLAISRRQYSPADLARHLVEKLDETALRERKAEHVKRLAAEGLSGEEAESLARAAAVREALEEQIPWLREIAYTTDLINEGRWVDLGSSYARLLAARKEVAGASAAVRKQQKTAAIEKAFEAMEEGLEAGAEASATPEQQALRRAKARAEEAREEVMDLIDQMIPQNVSLTTMTTGAPEGARRWPVPPGTVVVSALVRVRREGGKPVTEVIPYKVGRLAYRAAGARPLETRAETPEERAVYADMRRTYTVVRKKLVEAANIEDARKRTAKIDAILMSPEGQRLLQVHGIEILKPVGPETKSAGRVVIDYGGQPHVIERPPTSSMWARSGLARRASGSLTGVDPVVVDVNGRITPYEPVVAATKAVSDQLGIGDPSGPETRYVANVLVTDPRVVPQTAPALWHALPYEGKTENALGEGFRMQLRAMGISEEAIGRIMPSLPETGKPGRVEGEPGLAEPVEAAALFFRTFGAALRAASGQDEVVRSERKLTMREVAARRFEELFAAAEERKGAEAAEAPAPEAAAAAETPVTRETVDTAYERARREYEEAFNAWIKYQQTALHSGPAFLFSTEFVNMVRAAVRLGIRTGADLDRDIETLTRALAEVDPVVAAQAAAYVADAKSVPTSMPFRH